MTPETITPFLKTTRSYFEGSTKVDHLHIAVERTATEEEIAEVKKVIDESLVINRIQPMSYHPFVHLTNGNEDTARCLLFCVSKITESGRPIYNISNEGGKFIITQNRVVNTGELELVIEAPVVEEPKQKAEPKVKSKEPVADEPKQPAPTEAAKTEPEVKKTEPEPEVKKTEAKPKKK